MNDLSHPSSFWFLENIWNELFPARQKWISSRHYRFVKSKLCQIHLTLFDQIKGCVKEGEALGIVDLNKTFDTVSHDVLISKLGKYDLDETGTRGVKKWLEIYTYQVLIKGSLSKWKDVLSDILQKPVLSPHLFNIFINWDDGIGSMFIKFAEDMEQGGTTSSLQIQNELVYWRNILKLAGSWMEQSSSGRRCIFYIIYLLYNSILAAIIFGVIAVQKVDMSQQCHM